MNFKRSTSRTQRKSLSISGAVKWKSFKGNVSRRNEIESDSEEDVMAATELKNWVEEFFVRKSFTADTIDQDVEVKLSKKQTLILSTLVPDEILLMEKFDVLRPKRFVGVLLMADVSGYTSLSEKYNNAGKSGTYRLTATLNSYLGSLVEVVYSHGGDIIKFAGDAFLALWKLDKRSFLCQTIHSAIACALVIQHAYGSFETDVKVSLKVKLAIAAGNLIFAPIGTGIDMNYIIIGLPVIEAKKAESVCVSGEVKLTPTAWGHCYSRNYIHVIDDDGHVTIKAILYDPHEINVNKPFLGFPAMLRNVNKSQALLINLADVLYDPVKKISNIEISKRNELLSLRKTILLGEEKNIGSEIRKFMIRPVLTQIDAHQPIEYLTEMRQVSVMFITLKPKDVPFLQLITIVNNSYQITCEIVYKSMGCVNKIILFDKDIMILVIFGLRGFKHESEAQAALKCAYNVKKMLSVLDGVLEVSIGVTTGQVYCGVVGHPLRREFTVIGTVVNKAARFMCRFHNKVTCDEATYLSSKLSSNGFTLQTPTELKGIIHPGKIYEYCEDIRLKHLFDIAIVPPLLNREDEMMYYINWLNCRGSSFRDFDALLLIGESRVGKTRLLEWMLRYARNDTFKTCHIYLTSIHASTPYLALSQIINQMLDINDAVEEFEKERKIVSILKYYSEDLCYLNKIIKVRFAYPESATFISQEDKNKKAKNIFRKFIKALPYTYTIFIDDLQNLDDFSWEYISLIIEEIKIFTVLTVTRGKFESMQSWFYRVYIKSNIRKIALRPLNSQWISPLACQILDVAGVPKDLCNVLISKCNGMPGKVETFISHLFSCGALDIKKINKEELSIYTEDLLFPDPTEIKFIALDSQDQPSLDQSLLENTSDIVTICLVTNKDELNTDLNFINLDALIMIQLDSLTPYQQLLLKIASVIGNIFSRDLLENIMYENDLITTAKAMKRLFAMRIISCANIKSKQRINYRESVYSESLKDNLICECCFAYDPNLYDNLPKYAFCKVMKFRNKNSRRTFYELLPLNQKKEFHLRIVNYLENNKQKCYSCGGGITIVYSAIGFEHNECDINKNESTRNDSISLKSNLSNTGVLNDEKNNRNAIKLTHPKNLSNEHLNDAYEDKPNPKLTNFTFIPKTHCDQLELNSQCLPSIAIYNNSNNNKTLQLDTLLEENNSEAQNDDKIVTIFDSIRETVEAQTTDDWNAIGIVDSDNVLKGNKKSELQYPRIKLEKGISQIDFTKCTCTELSIIVYEQLIYHAKEAELFQKVIEFIINYSYLNVLLHCSENLMPKLIEAETICQDRSMNILTKFQRNIYLGQIYSLKAYTNLLTAKYLAAKIEIAKALKIYGINLTKVIKFYNIIGVIKATHYKRRKYRNLLEKIKSDSIFCLNVATDIYSTINEETLANVAAQRALVQSHTVKCNIIELCDAFYNVIKQMGWDAPPNYIEKIAKNTLLNIHHPVQSHELFAIGKFFLALFTAHTARGQLSSAIRSGYQALVLSKFLCVTHISLDIIPNIFYLLISRCHIKEAVEIVTLLLNTGSCEELMERKTWYNALCMDLILDAGFQIETPVAIYDFAVSILNKGSCTGPSRRRLVLNLWTYWLRTDECKAKQFEDEALDASTKSDDDNSLKTLITSLRLAEGMLESLVRKVEDLSKIVDLRQMQSLAEKELNQLEEDVLHMRAIYPRWILLKAYSLSLAGRKSAANSFITQALEAARKNKNRLEEATARAAKSVPRNWMENAQKGHFIDWQNGVECAKTSWHKYLYRLADKH